MIRKRDDLSIRRQCELLNVTRSEVYYKPKTPAESAIELREKIMARIDYWHTELPACGSRKFVKLLKDEGYQVGRKLVRRYMAEMGIRAIYPQPNLSKRNFKEAIVPYLLRNYNVSFPNQVWSIDITFIKMNKSHMYLTAIIDWYSRKIVGWSLSDTLATESVLEALGSAVASHGIPSILNSDQGSQFTSDDYKAALNGYGIRQSMDGRSRWADNIMIERWFRSLKTELIYIEEFRTPRELRQKVEGYIKKYNEVRPHEALENETPSKVYSSCFNAA